MGIPLRIAEDSFSNVIYVDIRRFTPARVRLSQDNWQDAFDAAYAWALDQSNTLVPPFMSASPSYITRYQVLVPEGIWWIRRSIVIPSAVETNPQNVTPGISGVDQYSTSFMYNANDFVATNNAIITAGGDNGDAYTYYLLLEKFNIQTHGSVSDNVDGICATLSFGLNIRDVLIFGMVDRGWRPNRGFGIKLLDKGTAANNQYPQISNTRVQNCTGGLYAINCLPLKIDKFYSKHIQNFDAVFSGCVVSWDGGSVESASPGTSQPIHNSKGVPRIVTGWDQQIATGSGASVGVASGDVTTVSGLSGMSATDDLHRWLYLEQTGGAAYTSDGADKVSGYYLITKVLSATSVQIRKGSTHSATSGLIWKTVQSQANEIDLTGMIYHEGPLFAGIGLYAQNDGAGRLMIRGCNFGNTDFVVESLGTPTRAGASVKIDGTAQATYFVKARYVPSIICLDAPPDFIGDVDDYSREGMIIRADSYAPYGVDGYVKTSLPGGIRTSQLLGADARTMCVLGGANALWDARVSSSFVKSGADVTSWTDLINGIVASLVNAGKFPQYSDSDAKYNGKPSVTFTGGTAVNSCSLVATIPAAKWGPFGGIPCIVAVMSTPAAAELSVDVACRLRLVNGASVADMSIVLLENYGIGATYIGANYPPGDTQVLDQTPDTNAHVFIQGGGARSIPRLSSERKTRTMSNWNSVRPDEWAPLDSVFRMNDNSFASSTGTLTAAFIAVFPHGLGYEARETLIGALCHEFNISR